MVSHASNSHILMVKNYFMTVAPNITTSMEGEEFNITERSNGSITCTATGYPVPTVVWQNSDGSSLGNNRLVSSSAVVSTTGVGNVSSVSVELMVIGALRVDSGMYRCSANNSVNSTTRNVTITVQCKCFYTTCMQQYKPVTTLCASRVHMRRTYIYSMQNFVVYTQIHTSLCALKMCNSLSLNMRELLLPPHKMQCS